MTELWQMSAVETAWAISSKQASAREVVDAHLARIEAVNPTINAVTVTLAETARSAADAADKALAAGETLGPLHGVPVTFKENTDIAGVANTNGVAAFKDNIATENSPVVDLYKAAGAIPIGRTNTPEFSLRWHADNPLWGQTMNPWNEAVTPGGSSGGAASSIASGIGCIAHGTDLGGSVRYPAYCCGVVSLKTTPGRVPSYTPSAPAERPHLIQTIAIQGVIAREVRDLRAGLAAIAVADPTDPEAIPMPLEMPPVDPPIRVAVSPDPIGDGVDPAVAAAVEQAGDILAKAGYAVERADPPAVAEIADAWNRVVWGEVQELWLPMIREHGSDQINQILDWSFESADAVDLNGYAFALADRNRLARLWSVFMADYPLVVAPVSFVPPMAAGEDAKGKDNMLAAIAAQRMQTAVNYLNLPAVAVPTGLNEGVPMGVQIIGRRFREDMCLDAADEIERDIGVLAMALWAR